ncbi:MAG TPA: hypothetical protein VMU39_01470 [Solirubrobacteraceae bacterium]|nr:hypothetical protein [Solirubrobacteraceae bacterium]
MSGAEPSRTSGAANDPVEWVVYLTVNFEADNAEDAEAVCQRLMDRVLDHPMVIEAEASCERAAVMRRGA